MTFRTGSRQHLGTHLYDFYENGALAYSGPALLQGYAGKRSGTYLYKVQACNTSGCGSFGAELTVTVALTASSLSAPGPISGPDRGDGGSYTLTWGAAEGAVTRYDLYDGGAVTYSGSLLSVTLSSQSDGTHVYRVQACNASGCGAFSAERSVLVLRRPGAPTGLRASVSVSSSGRYTLSWSKPAGSVVDGYRLERRCDAGAWSATDLGADLGASETQTTDGTYDYRVSARNTAGTGPASAEVQVVVSLRLADQVADAALLQPVVPPQQWVGTVAGTPTVEGGAGKYQIKVDVPPGRAGMQPEISLAYSSRDGNGVAGVGWSLSAGGAIHRCARMRAKSGSNSPVRHDLTDRLCFEGQQLVTRGGSTDYQPVSGTEYRTEIDTFSRIQQGGGDIQSWDSFFKVETKSGRTAFYKALAPSDTTTAPPPGDWQLAREFDRQGNCVEYRYERFLNRGQGQEEWVLKTIAYTGRRLASGSPGPNDACTLDGTTRAVTFEYGDRPDRRTTFSTGAASISTARLYAIVTRVGQTPVKRYELSYRSSQATQRSLLDGITECAGGTCEEVHLPATRFEYQEDAPSFTRERFTDLQGKPLGIDWQVSVLNDFDGDGTRDMEYRHLESLWTSVIRLSSCGVNIDLTADWNHERVNDGAGLATRNGFGDVDNDGRAEALGRSASGYLLIGRLTCSGLQLQQTTLQIPAPPTAIDLDGDGRLDLLYAESLRGHRYCLRTTGDGLTWDCSGAGHIAEPEPSNTNESAKSRRDFNGDGTADVFFDADRLNQGTAWNAFYDKATRAWTSRTLSELGIPLTSLVTGATNKPIWIDINGDGLPDIYRPGIGSSDTGVAYITRVACPGRPCSRPSPWPPSA